LKKENSLGKNGKIDSIQFFSLGKLMMMKIVKINVRKGRKRSPGYLKDKKKKENMRRKKHYVQRRAAASVFFPQLVAGFKFESNLGLILFRVEEVCFFPSS
jgi:hypothetical protein